MLKSVDYAEENHAHDSEDLKDIFSRLLHPHSISSVKIAVAKACRKYWAALRGPAANMKTGLNEAYDEVSQVLSAYSRSDDYLNLFDGDFVVEDATKIKLDQVVDQAFLRALTYAKAPKTIKTDDLINPFTGKPIQYSYSGGFAVITADGDEPGVQYKYRAFDEPNPTK